MNYLNCCDGRFVRRVNRFIAEVEVDGQIEIAHVKNTGRMGELLLPGRPVVLQEFDTIKRKTKYDLISILHADRWVNLDSQVNNKVVEQAFLDGKIEAWEHVTALKREVKVLDSRIDLRITQGEDTLFVEVKGVNLVDDGIAKFPDAVTARGVKHLQTLMRLKEEGMHAMCLFLIQRGDATSFAPHKIRDPRYADAFLEAKKAGVDMRVYDSVVTKDAIEFGKAVPIDKHWV